MLESLSYNVSMKVKMNGSRFTVLLMLWVCSIMGSSFLWSQTLDEVQEQSEETKKYLSTLSPDAIVQRQSLSLHIYFFGKGTAEEGFHGVLYKNGHEVMPSANMIKFKHYYLKHYGAFEGRTFTSSRSGWLPQDLRFIPPAGTGKTSFY